MTSLLSAPLRASFSENWRRVNRNRRCPICQHTDYCNVTEDETLAHCMRAERYPVPPGWVFVKFDKNGEGQVFRNEFRTDTAAASAVFNREKPPTPVAKVVPNKAQLASEEARSEVLQRLLTKLQLSEEHRQFLAGEGISLETAMRRGYRTLSGLYEQRKQLLSELEAEFGLTLLRQMGFCYERLAKRGGSYLCFAGVVDQQEALLFPIRNSRGMPVALKARWVDPATDQRCYRLMSAAKTELGAGVGTPIHVALPIRPNPELTQHLIITEGERKADSVAYLLGVKVLGVQGTGNWRSGHLLKLLSELVPLPQIIVLAYDQDESEEVRCRVERHTYEMGEQLAGASYRVLVAKWDGATGKGLDDFLRNAAKDGQRWRLRHFGPHSGKEQDKYSHHYGSMPTSPSSLATTTEGNEANVQPDQEDFWREEYDAFTTRYGISPKHALRVRKQFVKLDSETIRYRPKSLSELHHERTTRAAQSFATTPYYSLEEVHWQLKSLFENAALRHLDGEEAQRYLVRVTTGGGKSQAAVNWIENHLQVIQVLSRTSLSPTLTKGEEHLGTEPAITPGEGFEQLNLPATSQPELDNLINMGLDESGEASAGKWPEKSYQTKALATILANRKTDIKSWLQTTKTKSQAQSETSSLNTSLKDRTNRLDKLQSHFPARYGRVLYATDTKLAYGHLIKEGGQLYPYIQSGELVVQEGRNPDPRSPYYCRRYNDCHLTGVQRQIASADVCSDCPFATPLNWLKYAESSEFDPETEPEWLCNRDGYLAMAAKAREAPAIIAPKAAILNGSNELGQFDFVILDEGCTGYLVEKQGLSLAQIQQWWEGRRRLETLAQQEPEKFFPDATTSQEQALAQLAMEDKHHKFDRLFEIVSAALVDFSAANTSLPPGRVRLVPFLKEYAQQRGLFEELYRLCQECAVISPGGDYARYGWERPYRDTAGNLICPLRLAYDFINLLAEELALPDEVTADTQLFIERLACGGTGEGDQKDKAKIVTRIVVYPVSQHLLHYLNGTASAYNNQLGRAPTVFFLDATAGAEFALAIPTVKEINLELEQPLHVIQDIHSLYTPQSLDRPGPLNKISRTIGKLAQKYQARKVVVFSRKKYNPQETTLGSAELKLGVKFNRSNLAKDFSKGVEGFNLKQEETGVSQPEVAEIEVTYGHFERHNRGLNDYSKADLIAIVGHYSQPIEEIEARVMALRRRREELPLTRQNPRYGLRRYGWQSSGLPDARIRNKAKGEEGLARWCRQHSDPQIQAAIEHSTWANLMQTIGRGRAALRPKDAPPLVIAIFSAMPIAGLKVDELTTCEDLLEEARITERQRAALNAGREQYNQARHEEAVSRIETARTEFANRGEHWVAPARFARRAGINRSTLYRLGYASSGRYIRTGPIRAGLPLEMFIAYLAYPEATKLETSRLRAIEQIDPAIIQAGLLNRQQSPPTAG